MLEERLNPPLTRGKEVPRSTRCVTDTYQLSGPGASHVASVFPHQDDRTLKSFKSDLEAPALNEQSLDKARAPHFKTLALAQMRSHETTMGSNLQRIQISRAERGPPHSAGHHGRPRTCQKCCRCTRDCILNARPSSCELNTPS